jgi:hypothetical protein
MTGPVNHTGGYLQIHRIGKAVFDRMSGELISCIGFGVGKVNIDKILQHSKIHCSAQRVVVWYKDNTVFTSSLSDVVGDRQLVSDTGFISEKNLARLRQGLDNYGNWTSENMREGRVVLSDDGTLYTAYPVPVPPNKSDDTYEPLFLIINSVDLNHVCSAPDRFDDDINNDIQGIYLVSGLVGIFAISFIVFILWFVSCSLTQPLLWMKHVSWSIVNQNDRGSSNEFHYNEHPSAVKFRPRTEVSELVEEFQNMIEGFSGEGPASLAHEDHFEILNQLTWQSDFQSLYSLHEGQKEMSYGLLSYRMNPDIESTSSSSQSSRTADNCEAMQFSGIVSVIPAPTKKHRGMNARVCIRKELQARCSETSPSQSSLFWWVLCLIVAPLLMTSVVLSFFAFSRINDSLSSWELTAEHYSSTLEAKAFCSASRLKAMQANIAINSFLRDMHVLTRMAGWLLFDGANRSAAFTYLEQATQECRNYTYGGEATCPFFSDAIRAPCACEWEDVHRDTYCHEYNQSSAYVRDLQHGYFMSQKRDFDPATGNRTSAVSFGVPGIDDSGATTSWWDNFNDLPGSDRGGTASGSQTAYDRVRVASAMAVVEIPIYNHAVSIKHAVQDANSMLAFEADGMVSSEEDMRAFLFLHMLIKFALLHFASIGQVTGYAGCNHMLYGLAGSFQSNDINHAAEIAPDLCPLGKLLYFDRVTVIHILSHSFSSGKFGYDPRCREWYSTGKQLYEQKHQAVYVTDPYASYLGQVITTSATAAIVNPSTDEYVGQINFDFIPRALQRLFDTVDEGAIGFVTGSYGEVIVTNKHNFGEWNTTKIEDLLFPYDDESTFFRTEFERSIFQGMLSATNFTANFSRTSALGPPEIFSIVSHTVKARSLLPIDPSEFSRGCTMNGGQVIYVVGLAYPESQRKKPWELTLYEVEEDLCPIRIAYISIIVVSLILFVVVSFQVRKAGLTLAYRVNLSKFSPLFFKSR